MANRSTLWPALLLLLSPAVGSPAADTPQEPSKLSEREEVTAIDLVLELSRDGERAIEAPSELTPADFIVTEDGRRLTVVGGNFDTPLDPWHFLVYFDLEFIGGATVRWAASALADLSATLVEMGSVEVVVADPEPRRLLAASRDAELVSQVLSGVYLGSAYHAQLELREEFLLERAGKPELERSAAASRALAAEQRLVVEKLDAVLDHLVVDSPARSRRALLLVSDGFDGEPQEFYAEYGGDAVPRETSRETIAEWTRTVAAYGWTAVVLTVPPSEEARAYGLVPTYMEDFEAIGFKAPGLTARLEGTFNPERAAALHELGQRLAEQGKWEEAEAELREALGFYHDSPKYARQRSAVLADLGQVLLAQGRTAAARDAMRTAVALDGERASDYAFVEARLVEPAVPLEQLADVAAGRIVRDPVTLAAAVTDLDRRVRVTFQLEGPPDGLLHPVEVSVDRARLEARAAKWVRFGTPESVDALRARRLLGGRMEKGTIELEVRFEATERTYGARRGELTVEIPELPPGAGHTEARLRVTIGLAGEEGPPEVFSADSRLRGSTLRVPVTVRDDQIWASVVVADLDSGRWGATVVEP